MSMMKTQASMLKKKSLLVASLVVLFSLVLLPYVSFQRSAPKELLVATVDDEIKIPTASPPKDWVKFEVDDFVIYFPPGRVEHHTLEGEEADGFAMCPLGDPECKESEVSVYLAEDFTTPEDWFEAFKIANSNLSKKYFVVSYPNYSIAGNRGIGAKLLPLKNANSSEVQIDTSTIFNQNRVYGITYDHNNPLHLQILGTLKFKRR